jgi:predicted MFS family arabinose efflux permease
MNDTSVPVTGSVESVPAAAVRPPFALALALLFLGALPDGAAAPLLDDLFVQRYGASVAAAHLFMAVNLIGAVAAIPLLARLRRRLPPSIILAGAAASNGVLLAIMALPIGFGPTLAVRAVEGAADLIMLAVIFDLIGKAGIASNRGGRFGAASTMLILGVAMGVLSGGIIGRFEPILAFIFGAAMCLIVAAAAMMRSASFDSLRDLHPSRAGRGAGVEVASPIGDAAHPRPNLSRTGRGAAPPLWPPMVMVAADRAVAGVVATTLVFYFAHVLELGPMGRGALLATAMLILALGAWPAGRLGDRVGHLRLRIGASIVYAGSIMLIPFAGESIAIIAATMVTFGAAGAALMPTSAALAAQSGHGSVAMAAYHASGNIGHHLIGIGGAAVVLAILGNDSPTAAVYHTVLITFAGGHLACSVIAAAALRSGR